MASRTHVDDPLASPSGSFYALTDDDEGLYETIRDAESGKGVKLLFSKSKVYVHPSPNAKDNLPGYIALLQQKPPSGGQRPSSSTSTADSSRRNSHSPASSDLLLAWIPESALGDSASIYVKVDLCEGDSPPKQSYIVPPPPTVTTHSGSVGGYSFAIPVSAICSILARPPSLGWWYGSIIINSRAGDNFPALFFHDNECQSTTLQKKKLARENFDPFGEAGHMFWGADEVLRWLRRYVKLERSGAEPNIYLVEPNADDLKSFGAKLSSNSKNNEQGTAKCAQGRDAEMDPFIKFVKETGWNIMNQFSKVTTFTRRAANDFADNSNMPPQVKRLLRNPEVQTLQDEFDSARIYLARWAMGMAEQSDRDRRARTWTVRDVMELEETDVGEFELLEASNALSLEDRRKPVTLAEWETFFDARTGRLTTTVDEVKERVFLGGFEPDDGVRKEAWLFLLGVYEWDSTRDERKAQIASLRDDYYRLKHSWWERLDGNGGVGEQGDWWREQRGRIGIRGWEMGRALAGYPDVMTFSLANCVLEKDVHRTDRNVYLFQGEDTPHPDPKSPFAEVGTNVHLEQMKEMLLTYNEYNNELGYVQGMSDLLAPIYAVVQDDAIAFWGFQRFMDRMERNFLRDQSGMRAQLLALDQLVNLMDPKLWAHLQSADSTNFFFFFRMLLVWFKREFAWNDVLRLWEALWTDFLSAEFRLFVALAILEKHRDVIMEHLKAFDEVLKYINELSNTIELESTLIRAETLFRKFQRRIEATDKKQNFPKPRPALSGANGGAPTRNSSSATRKSAGTASKDSENANITPDLRRLLSREVELQSCKPAGAKADGKSTR